MTPFPWADVMAACLGRLGWPPDALWRATPREVAAALHGLTPPAPDGAPSRARLADLMARYPDAQPAEDGAAETSP